MIEFKRGDRVKLTEKVARTAQKGFCNLHRKVPSDWLNRRGSVAHTTNPGSGCVLVKWDDARWPDSWPKGAVEKVE